MAAARRCSAPAAPCRWTATPRCRIAAYARAWSARNRRPGQHKGPITRAFLEVLQALLWGFHNSRDGRCFPSYEAIAEQGRVRSQYGCRGAEGARERQIPYITTGQKSDLPHELRQICRTIKSLSSRSARRP